jgi:hypothetical protein
MLRANLVAALTMMLCVVGCGGGTSSVGGFNNGDGGGGGGGGNPTAANVQSVIVDSGPSSVATSNSPAVNTLYTSVTICVPGTSTCQTIDHIQVDTASSGLRIISGGAAGGELTLNLPLVKDSGGNVLAECVPFVDGSSWGTLRTADVKISGEVAGNQTIQVIGDPAYAVPDACSAGKSIENTVATFGANGIVGVGPFIQDCGSSCTVLMPMTPNPYYTCPSGAACTQVAMPLASQVANPVASFATDNNGVIIQLGSVNGTAATVSGSMISGIGTQGNNGLGNAKVYTLDTGGSLSTTYEGTPLNQSFIDSGSNAYYFPDGTIFVCGSDGKTTHADGFFCPKGGTLNLTATITGVNGVSALTNFSVANADSMFNTNSTIAAASALAAPSTGVAPDGANFTGTDTFDWGLPFYFGRTVSTAIETKNTSAGMGPYFAF